jgi:poly-gamma-glutamate capsule biosynthesis protein CapA/YwtB (metallophosphatase superfamily)
VPFPLTLAACGDALITKRVAPSRDPAFLRLVDLLRSADVRFINLEGTLHDYVGSPQAASGGTYVVAPPRIIEDLKWMGFNLYSAANNHMTDWGEGGLLGTIDTLERAGVTYAGIGRHLQEARSPRYLEVSSGRVALIAMTSTFPPHAPAGEQRPDCQGRPGVNPLRSLETIVLDRKTLDVLADVHGRLAVDAYRDVAITLGFTPPDPEDISVLFGRRFRAGDTPGVRNEPHAGDMQGNLAWIRDARRQADWVIVSVHSHEMAGREREQPAEFLPTFCRAAVDAGADAVIGHGPHLLRGLEVYQGKPIFYSLGNFIFQNETLLRQPADFYERLGLPQTATPADLFDAREARGGFGADPLYWETVVPVCRFEGGTLGELRLYPATLGHGLSRPQRGAPALAPTDHGRPIIERVARLSSGCRIRWSDEGFGEVRW